MSTLRSVFAAASLALFSVPVFAAAASDSRVILKTGEQQAGEVLGVRNGEVQLAITTGATTGRLAFRLDQIRRVEGEPPAGFREGEAAFAAGDLDRALRALQPLVAAFRGLPADWARQASAWLGDIHVARGDLARAEAAYADYAKFYGDGESWRTRVGTARIALAKGDAARARALLEPVVTAALRDPLSLARADAAAAGQACLLLGGLAAAAGDPPGALVQYLRTVTLFYHDPAALAAAQKAADALRAAHPGLVVPP